MKELTEIKTVVSPAVTKTQLFTAMKVLNDGLVNIRVHEFINKESRNCYS